jgi:hypothetical protein
MPSSFQSHGRGARRRGKRREPIRRPVPSYSRAATSDSPTTPISPVVFRSTTDTDQSRISSDLRRVGYITAACLVLLVILYFVLPRFVL